MDSSRNKFFRRKFGGAEILVFSLYSEMFSPLAYLQRVPFCFCSILLRTALLSIRAWTCYTQSHAITLKLSYLHWQTAVRLEIKRRNWLHSWVARFSSLSNACYCNTDQLYTDCKSLIIICVCVCYMLTRTVSLVNHIADRHDFGARWLLIPRPR